MEREVLVLGFGVSGRSASLFLDARGYRVLVVERKIEEVERAGLSNRVRFISEDGEVDFSKVLFVVISPGIPKRHFLVERALKCGVEVISELELGFREIDSFVIGVTGTNGKTTTVSMIEHVLRRCGRDVKAVGNIGVGISEYITRKVHDIFVVELSSFQLEYIKFPFVDIGVILNIEEDHIDWHGSFENYKMAKLNIQKILKKNGKLLIPKDLFEKVSRLIFSKKRVFSSKAAFNVCMEVGIDYEDFKREILDFKRAPHRLQKVSDISGILFINDSKSTNPASLKYALSKIGGNIILIAGGADKGLSFKGVLEDRIGEVILIGDAAKRIRGDMGRGIILDGLKEAVDYAYKIAKRGDSILFSPGCSSFDHFKDYKDRGKEFINCVRVIEKRRGRKND